MGLLNEEAYEVKRDELVYDFLRQIDTVNKAVTLPEGAGTLMRGQILDFDAKTGKYAVHQSDGTASVVVAFTTKYEEEDTEMVVECYISGNFRSAYCISEAEITEKDWDNLRKSGIVLK